MINEPSARFAISPDERQVAIRSYRGDSWFVALFNVVKGTHESDIPDDWTLYVPATPRDRMAEELEQVREAFEEASSNLEHLIRLAAAPATEEESP